MNAPPEERMWFLVGRGRSGTELLRSMLDAHSGISIAPEALFIIALARTYRHVRWNGRRIHRFAAALFRFDRVRLWSVRRNDLEQRWNALPPDASYARRCAEVYAAHAAACGKAEGSLLGDKNPTYALFVNELMELFPNAKFVHLVRDYRDNVLSHRHVPFDLKFISALAYRWKHYNEAILAAAARAPKRFHLARYEDLLRSPAAVIEGICSFLGVQTETAILQMRKPEDSNAPEWHRHRSRPADPALSGRWQQSFSPKEIATMDRICQPLGATLGYAPAADAPESGWPLGVGLGWTMTQLERMLFRFPIAVQAIVLGAYRRLTGTVVR